MPVKIDPLIVEELAALDLVIWEAKHPREPTVSAKTGKPATREDKGWVLVSLTGPGVEECRAGAKTLSQAVNNALVHSGLCERVGGLRGAMMRLERAMWDASRQIAEDLFKASGEYDDDIPF